MWALFQPFWFAEGAFQSRLLPGIGQVEFQIAEEEPGPARGNRSRFKFGGDKGKGSC